MGIITAGELHPGNVLFWTNNPNDILVNSVAAPLVYKKWKFMPPKAKKKHFPLNVKPTPKQTACSLNSSCFMSTSNR